MAQPTDALPRTTSAFKSEIPWQDDAPDCLVVCCSDHRFEKQIRDLARYLGLRQPHVVQVPSGAALTLPMATAAGFISKALDLVLERIIAMKRPKTVILVAHHDCGAYKAEGGHHALVGAVTRLLSKKTPAELQREHLRKAASRLRLALRGVPVRAFYAGVVEEAGVKHVEFTEVTG